MTPEEIAEKRANGQCYVCSEKFSRDHKCTARGGVFCITTNDSVEDADSITDEDLRILHVLTGVAPRDTICLYVKISVVELNTLVDSSSTHTFIYDDVVCRLGLNITTRPDLRVTVANGERLCSPGVCATSIHGSIHGCQHLEFG